MQYKKYSEEFKNYNKKIHAKRVQFMFSEGLGFCTGHLNPKELHAFLIIWSAFGVKMTEKVESWINGAANKCEGLNYSDIGKKLKYHAKQEAGHEKLFLEDVKWLINKWNELYNDQLNLTDVLSLETPASALRYTKLHEDVINSNYPNAQVSIEYEIERISVLFGPKMLENALCTLGYEFEQGLSFLIDHIALDQGHTKFNEDLMERCFLAGTDFEVLAGVGSNALSAYGGFLTDCVKLVPKLIERETWKSNLTI